MTYKVDTGGGTHQRLSIQTGRWCEWNKNYDRPVHDAVHDDDDGDGDGDGGDDFVDDVAKNCWWCWRLIGMMIVVANTILYKWIVKKQC